MSTSSKLKAREIASKEMIAEEDRKQREIESKRDAKAKILGSVIGAAAKVIPGGKTAKAAKTIYRLNHPEWYKKFLSDPDLVASIPTWLARTQTKQSLAPYLISSTTYSSRLPFRPPFINVMQDSDPWPSVVGLPWVPSIGISNLQLGTANVFKSPLNQTLSMDITNLGKVNSRAINSDKSIPGLYILGVTDIHSFLAEIKFCLDVLEFFKDNDRNLPRALIEAKGFTYEYILAHRAEIRVLYSTIAARVTATLPIPSNLSYLQRRMWMANVLLKDSNCDKCAYYVFNQVLQGTVEPSNNLFTYAYSVTSRSAYFDWLKRRDVNEWSEWFDGAIAAITDDDDFMTFVANMRAAIPASAFAIIPDVHESSLSLNFMDDEIRQQIQNAITLPFNFLRAYLKTNVQNPVNADEPATCYSLAQAFRVLTNVNGDLYDQFANQFSLNERWTNSYPMYVYWPYIMDECVAGMGVLNSYLPKLSSDDMFTMTRLHVTYSLGISAIPGDASHYRPWVIMQTCGTEVLLGAILYSYNQGSANMLTERAVCTSGTVAAGLIESGDGGDEVSGYHGIYSIDGLFTIYVLSDAVDGSGDKIMAPIRHIDNLFYISAENLDNLHTVSVRSEFYIDPSDYSNKFIR